jgi:hypothetical protein
MDTTKEGKAILGLVLVLGSVDPNKETRAEVATLVDVDEMRSGPQRDQTEE